MSLSLIVPLWNEAQNIPQLVEDFSSSLFPKLKDFELVLVNNGSTDNSKALLTEYEKSCPWIRVINIDKNKNYGGAVDCGIKQARNEIVGFLSGDLQVSCRDVENVWHAYTINQKANSQLMTKGRRIHRTDTFEARLTSRIYTILCNLILGLNAQDTNGLPKIFPKNVWAKIPEKKCVNFVWDAQILLNARRLQVQIIEVPVKFQSRKFGKSSWSHQKIKTYFDSLKSLMNLKRDVDYVD